MAAQNNGALYYAVEDNDAARLAELLSSGEDADTFFEDTMNISSKSLLHVCCGKGQTDCLRVLIDHGAKLDIRDSWGQTPLMYCVSIQFNENAKLLLETCPELSKCQDRYGKSPLHCAVEAASLELVSMLLEFGADANIRNHEGFTPLMTSCLRTAEEEQPKIMKELILNGALTDLFDYKGRRTAMHLSAVTGNYKALEVLVDAGADVNAINRDLRTPLTNAIYSGTRYSEVRQSYMTIIDHLIARGADLNMNACESCNPLLACAQVKCASLMEFLLSKGTDPNVRFATGITPALVSASLQDIPTIRVLISYNCDLTIPGAVYKKRYNMEFVIDPFQMVLMEQNLELAMLMILAGYPISKMWNRKETKSCLNVGFHDLVLPADAGHLILKDQIAMPDLDESQSKKLSWIAAMSKTPRTLQETCNFTIRRMMGVSVSTNVNSLPLPKTLQDYVSLKHIFALF